MKDRESEVQKARIEIEALQSQLREAQMNSVSLKHDGLERLLLDIVDRIGTGVIYNGDFESITNAFRDLLQKYPPGLKQMLMKNGIVDKNLTLTYSGLSVLRDVMQRYSGTRQRP